MGPLGGVTRETETSSPHFLCPTPPSGMCDVSSRGHFSLILFILK